VTALDEVYRYHDGTKHHFNRFARSLGYLDWASQPNPFRSYPGAPAVPLSPQPGASATSIGDLLRESLGLSAWKRFQSSHWSLRVNPSSGNLHPTEAYVATLSGVFHYAADRHALEHRCAADLDLPDDRVLVALTSIHWREAWKYGERAFRYCQHDLGHAAAAIAIAAWNAGLSARLLRDWSHRDIAALTGIDREEDFVEAEREEPGCILEVVSRQSSVVRHESSVVGHESSVVGHESSVGGRAALVTAARGGVWSGRASQLSEDHVEWTFIDEIARATEDHGRPVPPIQSPNHPTTRSSGYPRALILQRRSALALDGRSSIDRERFLQILSRVMPAEHPPWTAVWWEPRIHLALFVHRVAGVDPGLYLLARNGHALDRLRAAMRRDFLWTPVASDLPLFALEYGDCRRLAERVSCDQEIAADGFFSLGMIADFDASLQREGPSFYRHLFWESGVVGQVLYLEGEAAGARGTGIGCFYDDPVHDVLGLSGHGFQSLYHFTIGMPIEDTRLTTEPGYAWER
jgi:SagB-type dehydrogenase family enzyme